MVFADDLYRGSSDCRATKAPLRTQEEQVPLGVVDVPMGGPDPLTAAACGVSALRVTVVMRTDHPCHEAHPPDMLVHRCTTGAPPVTMLVGRVKGVASSASTVLRRLGYTYVQPQVQVSGRNACERHVTAGMGSPPLSFIVAENRIAVPADAGLGVRAVFNWYVVTRPPPGYVER